MTYFGFLGLFLAIPILIMLGLTWRDARQGRQMPRHFATYPGWAILLLHLALALGTPRRGTTIWWQPRFGGMTRPR